jgi:hypothetical protein
MPGNNYPKLHNAMWPGLFGKGPDSEPPIDLDGAVLRSATSGQWERPSQSSGRRRVGAKFE